MLLRWHSQH